MGHLERCLSLYEAFSDLGHIAKILAYSNSHSSNYNEYNIEIVDWLNEDDLSDILKENQIIIIDSYLASNEKLKYFVQKHQFPVFLIDSKLKYAKGGCLFFPSIYFDENQFESDSNIANIGGEKYLLFRKSLKKNKSFEVNNDLKRIGISMGGSNISNEIVRKIVVILNKTFPNLDIYVYSENFDNDLSLLPNLFFTGFLEKEVYLKNIVNMDIVITNGGQSINEVLFMGIPSITIPIIDNQEMNAESWAKKGYARYLNPESSSFNENLMKIMRELTLYEVRKDLSKSLKNGISSKGSINAAKKIIETFESFKS